MELTKEILDILINVKRIEKVLLGVEIFIKNFPPAQEVLAPNKD